MFFIKKYLEYIFYFIGYIYIWIIFIKNNVLDILINKNLEMIWFLMVYMYKYFGGGFFVYLYIVIYFKFNKFIKVIRI